MISREPVTPPAGVAIAHPERLHAELGFVSEELDAHLDFEEATTVPLLARVPRPPAPSARPAGAGREHEE
ncbi:hypothetical protein ABZT34_26485 [Streptomyces sp. NPDC005329]|uniref:hypothetical protein n=1 Tax=Streptomyces sp. NPDC005329 TaxID=3157034 RepID=UPI0033BA0D2E